MPADTLDLTLLDSGSKDFVLAVARHGADLAFARLACGDALDRLSTFRTRIDRAIRGLERRPKVEELTDFGRRLFAFCVQGDIGELYAQLPRGHLVRIHVVSNSSVIQTLPWEYLQEPGQVPGPSRERSVVRIVPTIGRQAPDPLPFEQRIRVLFVAADPIDQEGVSWPELKASIERTFTAKLPAARFDIQAIEGATRSSLVTALRTQAFEILHFSGHGEIIAGVGHIVLTDRQTGKSSRMRADELGLILNGRGVRLVVLSACETSAGDFADTFAVTAAALVRCGVLAVVANQLPVPDATVATFVGALYEKLLDTGDIDLAMTDGRIQLAIELGASPDAALEWGIPTLYRHADGAQVFRI